MFSCLIFLSLCGCGSELIKPTETSEVPFTFTDSNGKQPSSWNKVIQLQLIPDLVTNTKKFGSFVHVEVDNLSENKISFPKGYNLKIFDLGNTSKEIPNKVNYSGPDLTLESTGEKIGSFSLIGFVPDIKGNSEQKLRIYIVGEMLDNDPQKNQLVGAYIDIVLHP